MLLFKVIMIIDLSVTHHQLTWQGHGIRFQWNREHMEGWLQSLTGEKLGNQYRWDGDKCSKYMKFWPVQGMNIFYKILIISDKRDVRNNSITK